MGLALSQPPSYRLFRAAIMGQMATWLRMVNNMGQQHIGITTHSQSVTH